MPKEFHNEDRCSFFLEVNLGTKNMVLVDHLLRRRNRDYYTIRASVDSHGFLIPDVGELLGRGPGLEGMNSLARWEMAFTPWATEQLAEMRRLDRENPDLPLADCVGDLRHAFAGLPNEKLMFPRFFHEYRW